MQDMRNEFPVYLFTGFLGGGKTTFIQDVLGSPDFCEGERVLLILCEEGEEEYDPGEFAGDVFIETIGDQKGLTVLLLDQLRKKHDATLAVMEWNGMWEMEALYRNLPPAWLIVQQMMLVDAGDFLLYNTNLRQQTFDQMKGAEMIAFNRCVKDENFPAWQQEVHRIVRVANRRTEIIYEFGPDDVILDDIPDPLPYDMEKPLVQITEENYAEWYRDMGENQDNYEGKEITVRGRAVVGRDLPPGRFVFGRHVMTCCEADIEFSGLLCIWDEEKTRELSNGQWVDIRARVHVQYEDIYEEEGPVLFCSEVTEADPCDPEVARF